MRRMLPALALALASGVAAADDVPASVTAKREEVSFHVDLNGVYDAKDSAEVAYRPQSWGEEAEVEEARAAGPVKEGDVLVRFKSERIDDALRAAERDLGIAKAWLAAHREEQARQAEAVANALARAEFDAKNAAKALDHFLATDKPLRLEENDHNLQGLRNWETDQVEELAQLEKMYAGDDLTEETEDIVLKRARRDLERTRKYIDFQVRRSKVMREIELPREEEHLRLEAKRTQDERDRVVAVTALQQAQSKLELARSIANVEKQERDFAKLQADRALFELKATAAGHAVPGALLRGKWQNADDVKRALRKGGRFRPGDVVFTIVKGEDVRIATSASEAALAWLRPGQEARVVANAAGVPALTATVSSVQPFSSSGEYAVELAPTGERTTGPVGLTCKVRVLTGTRAAILVPAAAVEDAGFEKFVHVLGADGRPSRRAVTLGQTFEDRIEIASGLAEGESVLAAAPKK